MAIQNDPLADVGDIPDRQPEPQQSWNKPGQGKRPGHSPVYWLMFAGAVLIAAILIVFIGWLPRHRQQENIDRESKARTTQLPRTKVEVVRFAPAARELTVPGTTLAQTEANIYARASGYVTRRFADIGDRVHKGQLLATIDAPDLDQQVAQARSSLAQSQSNQVQLEAQLHLQALNWERYKVLVAKGVFSRQEGDTQEANYRVAEANVRAAEQTIQGNRDNLARLVVLQGYEQVRAPFNGVVTARNIDVGALISAQGTGAGVSSGPSTPGTTQSGAQGNNEGAGGNLTSSSPTTGGSQGGAMFTIASIDRLRILVSVPEAYTSAIRVGERVHLFFQEMPNNQVEGRVARTSASIDQNTRTLLVEVQVSNTSQRLLPGMYVVANFIDVKAQPSLVVPGESIVVRNGTSVVALLQDNVVHYRPIRIGRDYGDKTEVVGGVKAGDVIVDTVTDDIQDGVKVDPQYPQEKAQPQRSGQSDQGPGDSGQYGDQRLDNPPQKSSGKAGAKANSAGSNEHR